MTDFLRDTLKELDNEYASVASEGVSVGDITGYISTNSYILNGLVSGSIYRGIPEGKITALAGEESVGKTFILLEIMKTFLDQNKDGVVFAFESESALSKEMLIERGIDIKRIAIIPVVTVQEFRNQSLKVIEGYKNLPESKRNKILITLDSMGMLSTIKEVTDVQDGKEIKDMTRAQVLKGAFRLITLAIGKTNIPMVLTNHTYKTMGLFATKEFAGGSGCKYAASTILYLSKKKVKDGTDVIGNIIHCKLVKSRISRQDAQADIYLSYQTGIDSYYGLIDLGFSSGLFQKVGHSIVFPDGTKVLNKKVRENPKDYFTKDVLKTLDKVAKELYSYGSALPKPKEEKTK